MLISGNSQRLSGWKTVLVGVDALFICTAITAMQLAFIGNVMAGMGVVVLFTQIRSLWTAKRWQKVFNTKLTWNDYLLIFTAFILIPLIFTGHAIAADPVAPEAGKGAATGLAKAWETLFKGDGSPSFFGTLANALKGIGIIALVMQSGKVLIKFVSSEGEPSVKEFARSQLIERIIPNALVIMMLANNGAGGANLILTARSFIFSWDKVAYTAMKDVAESIQQQAIIEEERKILEEVRALYNTCISMPPKIGGENNPVFTQCIGEFQSKSLEVATSGKIKNEAVRNQLIKLHNDLKAASNGNDDFSFGRTLINIGSVLSGLTGSLAKDGIDKLVNSFVTSIGVAYNFCIELALMLMGVSLPLVLMLSLYKIDVFLRWLPQLLNLFVAKISYTIVGGLVQYLKADAGADLGMWGLAILMGFGAPLVSIFVAMALSGSMGAVFEREAVRGGAAAARIAAGGVAAAGQMAGNAIGSVGAAAGKTVDVIAKRV
jgi:hypothetical protein